MDTIEKELDKIYLEDLNYLKEVTKNLLGNISVLPKNAKSRKEVVRLLKELIKILE